MDKFSRDLAAELKPMGVTIQTVHPGWVVTNMSKLRKSTMTAPDPDTFAKSVFNTLGLDSRTSGYWFHKIQVFFSLIIILNSQYLNIDVCFSSSFIGWNWSGFSRLALWSSILLSIWKHIVRRFSRGNANLSRFIV